MDRITMAHGSGGKITHRLIEDVFFRILGNEVLDRASDSAVVPAGGRDIAVTTDSFVVKPLFFPGGDIGKIAICGTVNDLAVSGAVPRYITCGFIIEEGFPLRTLEKIVTSMADTAGRAGVNVVAGDTKVVGRGEADGLFINTSGVGIFRSGNRPSPDRIEAGDKVVLNGTIGDHGVAVLGKRKGLRFESEIMSDCAPLNRMIEKITDTFERVKFMRDPTRGGLATTLNEITRGTDRGMVLDEEAVPVSESVKGASELLGLDPLYIANEGKVIFVVPAAEAEDVVSALRNDEYGRNAAVIGEITDDISGRVSVRTRYGVTRIVDMLMSEQLPRIC
jgi:hydrogenase expression/formation protein HypE